MSPTNHTLDVDTEKSIERLKVGMATQEDLGRALYYLVVTRWSPEQLERFIAAKHTELCRDCPQRRKPLDINAIVKTVLWIVGALVAIIATLTKTALQ